MYIYILYCDIVLILKLILDQNWASLCVTVPGMAPKNRYFVWPQPPPYPGSASSRLKGGTGWAGHQALPLCWPPSRTRCCGPPTTAIGWRGTPTCKTRCAAPTHARAACRVRVLKRHTARTAPLRRTAPLSAVRPHLPRVCPPSLRPSSSSRRSASRSTGSASKPTS